MAHISRPFQVALAAVAVLALVWVVALHRPSSSASEAQSAASAPAPSKAATPSGSPSGAGSSSTGQGSGGVYHGSAPGVEGLTRAIAKANGAVATSQQNAKQLEEKSAQASSSSPGAAAASPSAASAPATSGASGHSSTSVKAPATKSVPAATAQPTATVLPRHTSAAKPTAKPAPHHAASAPVLANQHLVEAELKQGKTVVLLFWSSKGSDDIAVRASLRQLAGSDRGLSVHATAPSQVASYGSITRGVQVYGTPTLLIVAKHGRTIVLTGLQDAFAIRQAIADARHA